MNFLGLFVGLVLTVNSEPLGERSLQSGCHLVGSIASWSGGSSLGFPELSLRLHVLLWGESGALIIHPPEEFSALQKWNG